jgi:hypothetical protein
LECSLLNDVRLTRKFSRAWFSWPESLAFKI